MKSQFKYIIIPVNSNDPVIENEHDQVTLENDAFYTLVRGHFSSSPTEIADITALLLPRKETDFYTVSMYSGKSAQVNERASDLGRRCGLGERFSVKGDIFVSRLYDCEAIDAGWFRVDFTLSDLQEAAWISLARDFNKNRSSTASLSSLVQKVTSSSKPSIPQLPKNIRWSEDLETGDLFVDIPGEIVNKRDLMVRISPKQFEVSYIEQPILSEREFFASVKADECVWSLEENRVLHVYVEKSQPTIWGQPFTNLY